MSETTKGDRKAIVLFNLGGPDSIKAVKPFLFNLFHDPAIITLPNPFRFIIAKIISNLREKTAQEIYKKAGGKSPIVEQTEAQKDALVEKLKSRLSDEFQVFICMRYSRPRSEEVVREIKHYDPTEIIMLPLYPQFSTTTTGSSFNDFTMELKKQGLSGKTIKKICCYPEEENFIKAHVDLILSSVARLKKRGNFRILFSAHGLPVKIIKSGDPYQWQIEKSVEQIVQKLEINNLDYKIAYQSKVGPLEWLKPSTEEEIKLAGREGKDLVIVPIAFVSEHVETIVELDIEYKALAAKYNIEYIRVPALSLYDKFIESLAELISRVDNPVGKICPLQFKKCICS